MPSAASTHHVAIESAIAGELPVRSAPPRHIRELLCRVDSVALLALVGCVLAASVVIGLISGAGPAAYLGEWTAATLVSGGQLLLTAALLGRIFLRRRGAWIKRASEQTRVPPYAMWAVMASGFLFLAADELFELHERTDLFIHSAMALRETPLSDRIDDGIVVVYALLGLMIMRRGRSELALFRAAWPALRLAFFFLFAMVVFDLLTNRWFVPRGIDPDSQTIKTLAGWGTVAEESLKLLGGAMFIIAFAAVWRAASAMGTPTPSDPAHRGQSGL